MVSEPAEHVASVAAVSTVVTPGEPVVELSQFVLPCQVHLLIRLPRSWAIRNRCAHVHEAEGTTWQRFPAAGATGDFRLGG